MSTPVRTTCPYCGVGCGVLASHRSDGSLVIAGDPDHPANFGRLCSKGAALAETVSLDGRLLTPLIGGERASWDTALDHVASRFKDTIEAHGPDSVALYVSGQILTEDYYVANKLMKGFVGSANIDTNSRLCMASSVAGHRRAFGSDTVPGCYEDLEEADLVVLVGSNLAWCHPVLFQRLAAARETRGTQVVVVDPRETATCAIADMHLAINSGADVALFDGLLLALIGANATDRRYIEQHTNGFRDAVRAASQLSVRQIAEITGLTQAQLHNFYELFVRTSRVVTIYSQGVNQSTSGTDKVNAIINCHLATGRIGKPGMGPFSVTGQPNAMGGREVGGLANMLAAHLDIENAAHRDLVQTFWGAPRIADKPGLKAVDLFRAVGEGRIKAIWIMGTNPVDSLPQADLVRAALEACPFVVVSEVLRTTDTTACGHVLLPSLAWGEKDGTVTNSERRISRQRAFLAAPGEARADWWQITEVAKRLGFADAFSFASAADIFAEHARLSAFENNGSRDFDIGRWAEIDGDAYDSLAPTLWPQTLGGSGRARFFADGQFFTPDRRARFVATVYKAPAVTTSPEWPLVLNTGRIRDQWHTMTRTARTPRLMAHIGEPFIEVHPNDAARIGLAPASLAVVESAHGRAVLRVNVTARQRQGAVFAPMHWTDQYASAARIDAVVDGHTDPVSGQPGLKHTPVRVTPYPAAVYAVAIQRERRPTPASGYWALAPVAGGWRIEMSDVEPSSSIEVLASGLYSAPLDDLEVVSYADRATGAWRLAAWRGEVLELAVFASAEPVAVSRAWLAEQLTVPAHDHGQRLRLLAGRPGGGQRDRGAIVCACFDVGRNDIEHAIRAGGCRTTADVGKATSAGTNCGSCRAEIGRMLLAEPAKVTATA